ncbi:MAG: 2OG-Fe(II) oxygenase [Acidobacteria bacterium]|nr:2OG-Fe(II) oxygenase [Acidobacteriota bacterium]
MTASDLTTRFGLFLVRDFLDAPTCARVRSEMRTAEGGPATVYVKGSTNPVDERVRKTTRLLLSDATTAGVRQKLLERLEAVAQHFKLPLTDCEMPQFLFYRVGDFFVPHQDGDAEQLEYDHLRIRRVSIVIFLNGESGVPGAETYSGGSLAFYDDGDADPHRPQASFPLTGETGLLVAFRSNLTHEVRPVTRGERFTSVSWYR